MFFRYLFKILFVFDDLYYVFYFGFLVFFSDFISFIISFIIVVCLPIFENIVSFRVDKGQDLTFSYYFQPSVAFCWEPETASAKMLHFAGSLRQPVPNQIFGPKMKPFGALWAAKCAHLGHFLAFWHSVKP